jgi:hypothetical protein
LLVWSLEFRVWSLESLESLEGLGGLGGYDKEI